jgi:hypothetical protein
MIRKIASGVVAASLLWSLVGCSGNETGTSEGNSCTTSDECDTELICQPVTPVSGQSGDYCCPAPLVLPSGQYSSGQGNCQPKDKNQ